MAQRSIEFFVIEDRPTTVLRRSFEAPTGRVLLAWTDATILPAWWGPFVVTAPECHFDLREDGPLRLVTQAGDGTRYPMVETPHDVVVPDCFPTVNLAEHPGEWVNQFRPTGTYLEHVPVQWRYEDSFSDAGDSTTVEVCATYPVVGDRDALVRLGGQRGWAESFVKLDTLLA